MALQYVNELLMKEPGLEELDLADQNIGDLREFMPALVQFGNLRRMDLSDNTMNDLPHNMSELE